MAQIEQITGTRYRLWHGIPAELKDTLLSELRAVEAYLPSWCLSVSIAYESAPKGGSRACVLEVKPSVCYRNAKVWVYPAFFDYSPEMRRATLIHEITHLHTAGLYFEGSAALQHMEMPEGIRELLKEKLKEQWEAACEDVALAVTRYTEAMG